MHLCGAHKMKLAAQHSLVSRDLRRAREIAAGCPALMRSPFGGYSGLGDVPLNVKTIPNN